MLRRISLLATAGAVVAALAAAAAFAAPQGSSLPYITGSPLVGDLLSANTGTWSGSGTVTYTYQWQRCAAGGVNCADVPGATNQTYQLTGNDAGSSLRVVVTATDGTGASSATSAATTWVMSGQQLFGAELGVHLSVNAADVALPNRLFIDRLQLVPGAFTSRSPVVARIHVTDLQGDNVGGALVAVSGLPSTWATTRIEAVTTASGWGWLRIFPTKTMPLTPGHLLGLVVRARVPGSSGLSATSVRRVFQAPVR